MSWDVENICFCLNIFTFLIEKLYLCELKENNHKKKKILTKNV